MELNNNMAKFLRRLLALFLLCLPLVMLAQSAASTHADAQSDRIAKLEQQIADSKGSADNAWMLVCSALVLMMTGPGLALFYGGLVRKKNVLATMMQSFILMAVVTVLWAIVGYSLAFGEGNVHRRICIIVFLHGVGARPNADYAATIPQQTFMVYQLMFAIITPALISGAFAERMKFSAMLLFMILWSLLVYFPMAHMVWGKGGLLNAALGGRFPTLDFAGGTVVHITSGVSALVCALYLGKRVGYPQTADAAAQPGAELHRRLPAVGGLVRLQCRQRPGSAGSLATSAFVATHFAAAAGDARLGWRMDAQRQAERSRRDLRRRRRSGCDHARLGFCHADVRRLGIGAIAGVVCYLMVAQVKARFGYDDSLDAFGVHGAGGTLGALLTGVFASSAVNPIFKDASGRMLASGAAGRQHASIRESGHRSWNCRCLGCGGNTHHLKSC